MYDLYVCFTLVRWLPHPTRKSLVSRRSTSAIFPHRHSLAFWCSQAVKESHPSTCQFFQEAVGDVEFADSVEARMLRTREILQPTHSNYNTCNTQHVWNKTRRKSSGGSGGGEDFCYKTTPSSSGSMAVWSSNSPLCAKCMRCSSHYVTPWPGTLADVVVWQWRHWWERCQLYSLPSEDSAGSEYEMTPCVI